MELDVKIEYLASIEELIDRHSGFEFLKKSRFEESECKLLDYKWYAIT